MTDLLHAQGIRYAYNGTEVLRGVDILLAAGSITAIAGANGSGKSTLVEVLAGVRQPHDGAVQRRGDVALVVQRTRVPETLPISVAETVAMGTWARRRARGHVAAVVADALERVGLADAARRSLHDLSGGQRQRVLIAQGIARNADVLLLDEPAAGLDDDSRERIRAIFADEAMRGRAIGWVSHDADDIASADRVVRLAAGRVAICTTVVIQ